MPRPKNNSIAAPLLGALRFRIPSEVCLLDEFVDLSHAPMLESSHLIDTVCTEATCIYHFNTSMQASLLHAAREVEFDPFSAGNYFVEAITLK